MSPREPRATKPSRTISLIGIPYDANSTYLRGPAEAPQRIREALYCNSSNLWTEDGIDLGQPGTFHDAGDLSCLWKRNLLALRSSRRYATLWR
jgi:arginase family enzyme